MEIPQWNLRNRLEYNYGRQLSIWNGRILAENWGWSEFCAATNQSCFFFHSRFSDQNEQILIDFFTEKRFPITEIKWLLWTSYSIIKYAYSDYVYKTHTLMLLFIAVIICNKAEIMIYVKICLNFLVWIWYWYSPHHWRWWISTSDAL